MRYEGALLVVKDVEVSRRFYQDLLALEIVMDLGDYVVFKGFCLLSEALWNEFNNGAGRPAHYGHNASQLAFEEEDIYSFLEHFKSFENIEILCPLKEYPWGQRSFRFYDPDGHVLEVGEDMKVVVKRFLKGGLSFEETVEKTMYPPDFVKSCLNEIEEAI